MSERKGDWMQTVSGRQFWPLDPCPSEVFIEDIAHALSNLCRFGGHCDAFYSVAEHSVHVSHSVPPAFALLGLMHDATEAYLVDLPRPVKRFLPGYIEAENNLWRVIAQRFGLAIDMPPEIKAADNAVLVAEAEQIMKDPPVPWNEHGVEPADITVECLPPALAAQRFLERYVEVRNA